MSNKGSDLSLASAGRVIFNRVSLIPASLYVAFLFLLLGHVCCGQRIYRSRSDSALHESLRRKIADNVDRDIRSNNDALQIRAEKLMISALPAYRRKLFSFLTDLERTDRPDTIRYLGIYLLNEKELPGKVAQCVNLMELDISGCDIRTLPAWLGDLKQLQRISVSKSGLKKIRIRMKHSAVTSLNLSYNEFRRIPKALTAFDSLEELNLTGNRLTALPRFLNRLTRLELLNVGYNHLRRDKMKRNNTLKSLNLSHNQMASMPFSLAGFSSLMNINLSYNALTEIRKDIGGKELLVANLYSNRLTHIPEVLINHAQMLNLDLSHNYITDVPRIIDRMKSLTDLSLWGNEVSQLPNELGRVLTLSTIYMQGNTLSALPDSLARLSLRRLDVGYNRLTALPQWIFEQSSMEELYINNNDITELSEEILSLRNLRIFHVSGSPFAEDPKFLQLAKLLRGRGVNLK